MFGVGNSIEEAAAKEATTKKNVHQKNNNNMDKDCGRWYDGWEHYPIVDCNDMTCIKNRLNVNITGGEGINHNIA